MKAMNNTDKLRELDERMENAIVSYRVLEGFRRKRPKEKATYNIKR